MTANPHAELVRLLHAPMVTHALVVVAELGIADLLSDGPRSAGELAEAVGVNADALNRVLRALADAGVFRRVGPRTFAATEVSATLRTGAEHSLRDWARLWGIGERQAAFAELRYSVRTGKASFPHVHGCSWWEYLAANPDNHAIFNGATGNMARNLHTSAVGSYDLSAARHLVDVGGGEGYLAAQILRGYPDLTATLFDQPDVVRTAPAVFEAAGVLDRARVVGGDFFAELPAGADVYVLSMVLHDWDDAEAAAILSNVARAMHPGGKVLVVDAVLPPEDYTANTETPHLGRLLDLIMLTLFGGRERTEADWVALLARAGLRLAEIRLPDAPTALIVAEPAGAAS